jgi:hypothetical protein
VSAGKWFDGGAAPAAQCHRHTFINRHPSQPCGALNTLTARQWAKHHPTASRAVSCSKHPLTGQTLSSAATTRTRRSWCRCDAQHTHGTRLWLAGVGASWRDRELRAVLVQCGGSGAHQRTRDAMYAVGRSFKGAKITLSGIGE